MTAFRWMTRRHPTPFPSGWVLVRENGTGRNYRVAPKTLKRGSPVSQLSADQQDRVRRIAAALQEQDSSSPGEWLDNMSRDHHPEVETRIWEAVVAVYEADLEARPGADKTERHLLYGVLVSATMLPDELCQAGTVLSTFPAAKVLADLERVVERFRETRKETMG